MVLLGMYIISRGAIACIPKNVRLEYRYAGNSAKKSKESEAETQDKTTVESEGGNITDCNKGRLSVWIEDRKHGPL